MANLPPADRPPPYRLYALDRHEEWRAVEHPEWLEWEVWLWLSALCSDPWQEPSVDSAPPGPHNHEVRSVVVPETRVGITYVVAVRAKAIRLIEVADLP